MLINYVKSMCIYLQHLPDESVTFLPLFLLLYLYDHITMNFT